MRVLLTGASGFLGKNIIHKLEQMDCEIVALVRLSSDVDHLQNRNIEIMHGDLRDEAVISRALQSIDVVIHCAATMRGNWEEYYDVNVRSTELLLKHCKSGKIKRFVFISSVIVYNHVVAKPGTVFDESSPYESKNLTNYSRSKIEAEKLVLQYHNDSGVPAVTLRPAALYGAGGQIFPARLGFSIGKNRYLVIGNGNQSPPLSHVKSVADAVWRCIASPVAAGKCYNVVEDGSITQNDFLKRCRHLVNPKLRIWKMPYMLAKCMAFTANTLLGLLGKSSPLRLPYLKLCSNQYYYSNKSIKDDLDWRPYKNFEDSIDDMLSHHSRKRKPKRIVPLHRNKVLLPTDRILNVGIIGCGMFAETHLSILKKFKNTTVTALCDLNSEVREKLAKRFKVSNTYADINEMLSNEDMDVVHILTPAQNHAAHAISAMERKYHVLVEKPMAVNEQQAREMFETAKAMNVKLCVDHNHLFDEVMIKARELVETDTIGRIGYIESWYGTDYSSNTNNRYLAYGARDHWVYDLPGGLYQNMISHPISLLMDFMGRTTAMQSSAKYMHVVPHMRTDELRVLIENDKMLGFLSVSFATSPRYHYLKVHGTKGTLLIDFLNKYIFVDKVVPFLPKVVSRNIMNLKYATTLFQATINNGVNVVRRKYSLFEGNERLIHLFYRSILLDEPVPVSPDEGIQSIFIMDKIWNQLNNHKTSDRR